VAKLLFHCSVTERFAFDVEILALARRFGLPIAEVPVQWLRVKGSQIRPWTDARSMIGDVVRAGHGAATAAPVPLLTVKLPSERTADSDAFDSAKALHVALSPWLPVLRQRDGCLLVLCPLMSESEIDATAARIIEQYPGTALERTLMTVAQLSERAPLTLNWDNGEMAREEHQPAPTLIVGQSPPR
jgi:hypothetical protein